MASIRGADTNVIFKQGSTHATAVQGGVGDKLPVETIDTAKSRSELSSNNVGTGISMEQLVQYGDQAQSVDLTMHVGYNNNASTLIGVFMGAATSSPAEVNSGEGDYQHFITYDPEAKLFGTTSRDSSSTTVLEYPSCYPTNLNFTQARDQYLTLSSTLIADREQKEATTNTKGSLASATVANVRKVVGRVSDHVLLNGSGDAALVKGADNICPNSVTFNLTDAKDAKKCFSGTASDGAPTRSGLLEGTLTLDFLEMENHQWLDYRDNDTELKLSLIVEGAQINGGEKYRFAIHIPKLIVSTVSNPISSAGVNAFTATCKVLAATTTPAGMESVYPHFEIVNDNDGSILN